MAIVAYNATASPSDNGSNASTGTYNLTFQSQNGPGNLLAAFPTNMLCVVYIVSRSTTAATLNNTGSQTWVSLGGGSNTNIRVDVWYCIWQTSTFPDSTSFTTPSANCSMYTLWYEAHDTSWAWVLDQSMTVATFAAAASPSITGQTTTKGQTVTLASWHTPDDNTWGSISGTGWVVAGVAQYRNLDSQDASSTFAHKIQSAAGATGNVTKTQLTNGNDAGVSTIVTIGQIPSQIRRFSMAIGA